MSPKMKIVPTIREPSCYVGWHALQLISMTLILLRKKRNQILCLLGIFVGCSWGIPFHARACSGLYTNSNHPLTEFNRPQQSPLPAELRRIIESHPIFEQLHTNSPVRIMLSHHYYSNTSGWNTQSKFVGKILKIIFPNVQFIRKSEYTSGDIWIELVDPKVHPGRVIISNRLNGDESKPGLNSKFMIDINLIKSANAESMNTDGNAIRKSLGVPLEKKVLSIYAHQLANSNQDELTILTPIEAAIKSTPFDIVILSINRDIEKSVDKYFDSSVYLSVGLTGLDFSSGRVLIVNDTRGNMPLIHAASDKALIIGPVNVFESANVGTPTTVFNNQLTSRRSEDIVPASPQSSFITYTNNIDPMIGSLNYTLDYDKDGNIFAISQEGEKETPFDRLLKELLILVKHQI